MTQTNHEYECPKHGRFDKSVLFGKTPPKTVRCPRWLSRDIDMASPQDGRVACLEESPRVQPLVGVIWGEGFTKT